MEYQIKGTEHSNINVSHYCDGLWISVNRHCGYTSIQLSKEQAEELRDALIALTETENVE